MNKMKILHTADWHLDAPLSGLPEPLRDFLRQELGKIPEKIADLAIQENCDLILIAGDMFDGPYTRQSLQAVQRALARCRIPVCISPGNHDYVGPDSPWRMERWPENVHIFTEGMEQLTLDAPDCRIYGAGYHSMDCPPMLEGFHAEEDHRWQIGLLHGDPGNPGSPYCPVTTAQVRSSGLHYLALGHIHKAGSFAAGDTLCAWPGCPMGRGFDETGEKGVYIVELGQTGSLRFVPLNAPTFYDFTVDTGEDARSVLEGILPGAQTRDVYRVTLTGWGGGNVQELYAGFSHIPHLILRDDRETPVDLWSGADRDTLEGIYFGLLRELTQSPDPEQRRRALQAAQISRCLLEGREVKL